MSNETPPVDLDASLPFFCGSKRYSELNYPWAVLAPIQSRTAPITLTKNPSWIGKSGSNAKSLDLHHLAGQRCQIFMISDTILSICNFGRDIRVNGILLENRVVYAISFGFIISFTSTCDDKKGLVRALIYFITSTQWVRILSPYTAAERVSLQGPFRLSVEQQKHVWLSIEIL